MNIENRNKLIQLYEQKSKNFKEIIRQNDINPKKTFLKSKTNFSLTPLNLPELDDKSLENPKILLYENNKKKLPLFLPSIADTNMANKIILNSSSNTLLHNNSSITSKKKYQVKLRKIKIKNTHENNEFLTPAKQNKSLINLYNENLYLKHRLERYKIKKAENMGSFSYKKYNYNLMKYSSINLSQDSVKAFKKNMQSIENDMNGQTVKRKNRWLIFLDKIDNFAPEGLKKKIESLSEIRYKKYENMKNNKKTKNNKTKQINKNNKNNRVSKINKNNQSK